MNMQKSQTLTRRATALLSAIAASTLLGLPALAGGLAGGANKPGDANKLGGQDQAPASPGQMQCAPMTQSSNPSSTATPDASAAGAAQLPNQADPRAGSVPSDQAVSSRMAGSTADASNVQTIEPSNTRREGSAYGDVLAQGGATAGGFASQQVSAANNPGANRMASSRYSSNELRTNSVSANDAVSGSATMGNTGAAMNSNDSMRSSTMSQPSSQSPQMAGMTIAQCPSEMMPRSSTPESRQAPDQPTNPQMRQLPADGNGSRAR